MNSRQLDFFLRTAELCSLSRASEELGITQSGLSKSLQALETELQAPLFKRRSRGVELTQFGRLFLHHAVTIRSQMNNSFNDMDALRTGDAGELKIGTSANWLFMGIEQLILEFMAGHPNVQLQIINGNAPQLLDSLASGELDLVFCLSESAHKWPELDISVIQTVEQGLVVREGHPLLQSPPTDLRQLDTYGWVLPEQGTLFRQRLDTHFMSENLPAPRPAIEAFSRPFLMSIVAQTDHIGIATRHEIDANPAGNLQMLTYPFTWTRSVGVMRRRDEVPSVILSKLIDSALAFYSRMTSDQLADAILTPEARP